MSDARMHKVWDLPVRLFHWVLVILIGVLWWSGEFGGMDITLSLPVKGDTYLSNMDIHALAGQGVLILVLFRLLWGVWGSTTARFVHFLQGPSVIKAKLLELLRGKVSVSTGHNPLGGVMVAVMLLVLLAQAGTGLFSADDLFFSAPLAHLVSEDVVERMTGLHHLAFAALQLLIAVHIAAIGYYWLRGQNLVAAMITGRRQLDAEPKLQFVTGWRSLVSVLLAVAVLVVLRSL